MLIPYSSNPISTTSYSTRQKPLCKYLLGALSKSVKEALESTLSNGSTSTDAEEFLRVGLNDNVVLTKARKESGKTTTSSTATLAFAIAFCGRLCCRRRITSRTTEDALGSGSSKVVDDLSAADATLGRNVVVCLSSEVLVLRHGLSAGRVDDHDHALLAMLGLRAVDVHGLVVDNGDHEHGRISSLAVVVAVTAVSFTVAVSGSGSSSGIASTTCTTCTGGAVGVTGNGLKVGEDGVRLRLAGAVCVGGSDTVVL